MKKNDCTIDPLSKALYSQYKRLFRDKRRIQNTGWAFFPNITNFKITLKGFEPTLQSLKIFKKIKPTLEFGEYVNRDMNRYMEHNIIRLKRNKKNPKVFGTIVGALLKRSNVFRVAAISHVLPGGYKKYPLSYIMKANREVSKIINNKDDNLKFKRVYILKSDNTNRPLGVPSIGGRIFTHMLNNFLAIYLEDYLLKSQHAFIPRRGTLTAGKEIIVSKIGKSKYIYELDLEKFFDNIRITKITEVLLEREVPKGLVYYIENINRCTPELPKETLIDETVTINKKQEAEMIKSGIAPKEMMEKYLRQIPEELINEFIKEDGCENRYEGLMLQGALFDSFSPTAFGAQHTGVPQGCPTSPLLSILTLKDFLSQVPSVSYADDPIFYSDQDFEIKDDPYNGIIINKTKSGGIKRDGIGVKPLKYLGLEYDGKVFQARTRNGSTLKLGTEVKEVLIALTRYQDELESGNSNSCSWINVFTSKYIGGLQARMYEGNGNSAIEQDFRLKFVNGSGGDIKGIKNKEKYTLHNSSSYAQRSLVNLFRYNSKVRYPRRNMQVKLYLKKDGLVSKSLVFNEVLNKNHKKKKKKKKKNHEVRSITK